MLQHQRIGEILVRRGVITPIQCSRILDEQSRCHRPFGELAEVMFNVSTRDLESAWAEQYESLAHKIDPMVERIDPAVLMNITRRQAWQFRLIPMRYDGSELMVCTCREHLPRALRFAYQHFGAGCYFVLADKHHLADALNKHYPMDGAREIAIASDATREAAVGDSS